MSRFLSTFQITLIKKSVSSLLKTKVQNSLMKEASEEGGFFFLWLYNGNKSSSHDVNNYKIKLPRLGNWEAVVSVLWGCHNKVPEAVMVLTDPKIYGLMILEGWRPKTKIMSELFPAEGCKEEGSQVSTTRLGFVPTFGISWLGNTLPNSAFIVTQCSYSVPLYTSSFLRTHSHCITSLSSWRMSVLQFICHHFSKPSPFLWSQGLAIQSMNLGNKKMPWNYGNTLDSPSFHSHSLKAQFHHPSDVLCIKPHPVRILETISAALHMIITEQQFLGLHQNHDFFLCITTAIFKFYLRMFFMQYILIPFSFFFLLYFYY